jgi:hypothetical protein
MTDTEDPTAPMRVVRSGVRYLIAAPRFFTASKLAARADLSLRDWAWVETPGQEPAIFEKLSADAMAALTPPRGAWEK